MSIKSRIDTLEALIEGETETVYLKNGDSLKITGGQALELYVESINYVVSSDEELSELATKVKQAQAGRSRLIDTIKTMLGGD